MKKERKKQASKDKYGIFNNLGYVIKHMWNCRKSLIFLFFANIPKDTVDSLISNFAYSMVIALIASGDPLRFALIITGLKLFQMLFSLTFSLIHRGISTGNFYLNQFFLEKLNRKTMGVNYEYLESQTGQDKRHLAMSNIGYDDVIYNDSGARQFVETFVDLAANSLWLITMMAIITVLNPLILVALFATAIVPYLVTNRIMKNEHKRREEMATLGRKMNYIGFTLSDWAKTKDMRLFGIKELLGKTCWNVINEIIKVRKKYQREYFFGVDVVGALINMILYGMAYGILITSVLDGKITIAEFTFYFGIITSFSSWLTSLFRNITSLKRVSLSFGDLRDYLEQEENFDPEAIDIPSDDTYEIVFKNVCYIYNGAESNTLDNISFTIKKGEKIALVGLNGAGKTTIVKLMCGLIRPTSGEITVGGVNINSIDRKSLYNAYSVVFQDIFLLPVSVRRNISLAADELTDIERVDEVCRLAGISRRISEMPKGFDTPLVKSVREGADDLSGGEKQKLALARALYKQGKMVILDEPTAALDPIAENEMYLQYDKFTAGRTSVFISHRLSSTRFCDRILLLENGHISEDGTHEELMKSGGSYAGLFNMQAHYYEKEAAVSE